MGGVWRGNSDSGRVLTSQKTTNNKPWSQTSVEITFLNMMYPKDIVVLLKGTRKDHNAPENNPYG